MPLNRSQSRTFVGVFVALIVVLSVVATVLITRGWGNEDVQRQVEEQESQRRSDMPRFSEDDGTAPAPPAGEGTSGG
ncbi:MAG: hypothetical protein AAGK21_02425 [Bacteroidota bacterium]